MDEFKRYFEKNENCKRSLLDARKAFGSVDTSREQYEQMLKTLSLMYLYCTDEMRPIVHATLHEAELRKAYYESHVW